MYYFQILAILAVSLLVNLPTATASENSDIATLTRKIGKVRIFRPAASQTSKKNLVKIDDKLYIEHRAQRGDSVKLNDIVQTYKNSRARLVYENGDQINLAPTSQFLVTRNPKTQKTQAEIFMGEMRSVIDTEGPRKGMAVRTRSVVMGVRGTDFYVKSRDEKGLSEVTVLLGKVAVKPAQARPDAQPVEVPSGFSAKVGAVEAKKSDKDHHTQRVVALNLEPVKPEKLQTITKVSVMPEQPLLMVARNASPEEKARIEKTNAKLKQLEQKATENSLKNIKTHAPDLYKKLQEKTKGNIKSVDAISQNLIEEIKTEAQINAKQLKKPTLRKIDEDVYQKYFPVDE